MAAEQQAPRQAAGTRCAEAASRHPFLVRLQAPRRAGRRRRVPLSLLLAAALVIGSPGLRPARATERDTTIGLGIVGLVGASLLGAPSEQSVTVRGVHARPVGLPDDPGFAGLSAGGGIALELRAFRYFGLEIDLLRSRDAGTAELSVTQLGTTRSFSLEIVSVGWHVPLLLKGVLPTDPVRPFVAFGPEIVLSEQADAIVEGELAPGVEYRAVPRSYLMLTAAIGAELLLPVADTDLRIPLSLRASVTPAIGSSRDERARYLGQDALDISRVEYDARWQYQAVLTLGALVHF